MENTGNPPPHAGFGLSRTTTAPRVPLLFPLAPPTFFAGPFTRASACSRPRPRASRFCFHLLLLLFSQAHLLGLRLVHDHGPHLDELLQADLIPALTPDAAPLEPADGHRGVS